MRRGFWILFGLLLAASVAGWLFVLGPLLAKNRSDEANLMSYQRTLEGMSKQLEQLPSDKYIARLEEVRASVVKSYEASAEVVLKCDRLLEERRILKPGVTPQQFKAAYAGISQKLLAATKGHVFRAYAWETGTTLPDERIMPLVEKRANLIIALLKLYSPKSGVTIKQITTAGILSTSYTPPSEDEKDSAEKDKEEEKPPGVPADMKSVVRFKRIPVHMEMTCPMTVLGRQLANLCCSKRSSLLVVVNHLEFKPGPAGRKRGGRVVNVVMDFDVLDPVIYER